MLAVNVSLLFLALFLLFAAPGPFATIVQVARVDALGHWVEAAI